MTAASLAIIGVTILFSSFISALFGMAGGMVLLGVLLIYLDVATAMVLFSIIQLGTNGWRALHWRKFVLWPIFWWYVLGTMIAFGAMRALAFIPDKATVYILLGLMPFMVEMVPASLRPNIEWRGVPLVTGFFTTVIQFLSGVGELNAAMWGPAVVLSVIGAMLAPYVLERMTDDSFRQWTRAIIFIIAVVYLVRGALLLWSS
jgi:uncharacterized membrane protein YfcA